MLELITGSDEDLCQFWFIFTLFFQMYYISKGSLKTANKQYSSLKNDYEMSINNDTIIEEVLADKCCFNDLTNDITITLFHHFRN